MLLYLESWRILQHPNRPAGARSKELVWRWFVSDARDELIIQLELFFCCLEWWSNRDAVNTLRKDSPNNVLPWRLASLAGLDGDILSFK